MFFFTGELRGVDYLLSQMGQPLKENPGSEETRVMLEDVDEGKEEEEEYEHFKEDQDKLFIPLPEAWTLVT